MPDFFGLFPRPSYALSGKRKKGIRFICNAAKKGYDNGDKSGKARTVKHLSFHFRNMSETAFDAKKQAAEVEEQHPDVWVVQWGATMILSDFFIIRNVSGSTKRVALKLMDTEYGPFGEQRCIPRKEVLVHEVYAVRERPHGAYTGLAPDTQIHFGLDGWKTARRWDGKPQVINTLD